MRNIKLTIAYDGTEYYGFQEQRGTGLPTIQEVLESTLTKMAGSYIQVYGAGRTDSGVHARGQVINFDCSKWPVPTERMVLALNGILPRDIVAVKAEDVPRGFHARFSAKGKTYVYRVYNSNIPSPFENRYSLFVPTRLDIKSMQEAASFLEGTRDFKTFQAANSPVRNTVRTIHRAGVFREGNIINFRFTGDGFLYNMIRIIMGTLLEVGQGKRSPGEMPGIIAAGNRTAAGPTVPGKGLFLEAVYYEHFPEV
jgi:tRNA pseudouridine38-40 synthase